jgi:hypothetical protein
VLAEFAMKPAKSKKEWLANLRECLTIYADMVRPYKLKLLNCVEFPENQLQHEDARKAGCAPDSCAYEMKQKEPPKELIESGTLRSCGGHIHLGSELLASDGPEPVLAVYMLDFFVGVPAVLLDRDASAARRRSLYGQAGRYRTKPYGLEYRSRSNFWLASPQLAGLVYDLCDFVQDFVEDNRAWQFWAFDEDTFFNTTELSEAWHCLMYDPDRLRQGINHSDQDMLKLYYDRGKEQLIPGQEDQERLTGWIHQQIEAVRSFAARALSFHPPFTKVSDRTARERKPEQ